MMESGAVKSLWRYPVKSLIGESVSRVDIDDRGVQYDRMYAISNRDGKFGSGKNTRRFRRMDGLFSLSARKTKDGVSVLFPDNSVFTEQDEGLNGKLSQLLGQEVMLTREADISHFDAGAVHLLTIHSLAQIQELLPKSGIDERRFRPNLVLDIDLSDQELIGKIIKIGNVVLEVTQKTERCRMITLDQSGLESRPEILKTVSKHFGLDFGVYASVLCPGSVSVGDRIEYV